MDEKKFIRNRITELRMKKDVSEYQMSLELGKSKNYIQKISSGRAVPSMTAFLDICDYFELTPKEFFDRGSDLPPLVRDAVSAMKNLSPDDQQLLLDFIKRLAKQ